MISAEPTPALTRCIPVQDYDLAKTLDSGQVFRWKPHQDGWTGVIGDRWVFLRQTEEGILAELATPTTDWSWLEIYLQAQVDLEWIFQQFPAHPMLKRAVSRHRGLRLLRQDPWECLASFILSSTKQITHIKQIVERLCESHGKPVPTPADNLKAYSFPSPRRIAGLQESELRSLGMGFRAPFLLGAAEVIASGQLNLEDLKHARLEDARTALMNLSGVGRKIADCVLLFGLGFNQAFPVDVWVGRSLQSGWFPGQRLSSSQLAAFAETQFGFHAGYVQQYLFYDARTQKLGQKGVIHE